MKFEFDSYEEWEQVRSSAHDSIIFWKKQLQCVQGKVNMNVDGSPSHYSEEYCRENMKDCAYVLKAVEDAVHPDCVYNEDEHCWTISTTYVIKNGVDVYSCILHKVLKGEDLTPKGGDILETFHTEYENE